MRRRVSLIAALCCLLLVGCGGSKGKDAGGSKGPPVLGKPGPRADQEQAAQDLGFPGFATKNTTRVGGADPVADAAGVALAVWPSASADSRPQAVALVDSRDWHAAVSAAQLTALPVRAPVLFTTDGDVPPATADALDTLKPVGAKRASGTQALVVGDAGEPGRSLKTRAIAGTSPAAIALAIDAQQSALTGKRSPAVIVAPLDKPAFAMPAASLAANTGAPVLWSDKDSVPAPTLAAIRFRKAARIYVIGPESVIGRGAVKRLERLGTVRRISGEDPVANAIAVARFGDGTFGWNIVDPGHGLTFALASRPEDAGAAAALASAGAFGPLLLIDDAASLPATLQSYLLDIQPGYDADPVRGVYNHGWLLGDDRAISGPVQARIDALLEIQPVTRSR